MEKKIINTKYYFNNNNEVNNLNYGESRTIHNLLNLLNYKDYKNIFIKLIEKNNKDNNILELGCGLGIASTELCYLYNDNNYYAINNPRQGVLATGYEKNNFSKDYIIEFMKKYNFDMVNKKNINYYNTDLYKLDIFKNNYFDMIFSQSTIAKSLVSKTPQEKIIKIKELTSIILNKLKINGIFINHIDCIPKFNYQIQEICKGYKIINNISFFYEIFFSNNIYSQDTNNLYTEICLYFKKIDKNEYKKFNDFNENNINACKNSVIFLFYNILNN